MGTEVDAATRALRELQLVASVYSEWSTNAFERSELEVGYSLQRISEELIQLIANEKKLRERTKKILKESQE